MLDLLRDFVAEASSSHWSDLNLLRRLNVAQRRVALNVATTAGQWLTTSTSVTPSNSVITLPSDCAKPLYLEEALSGTKVSWIPSVSYRRRDRATGSTLSTIGSREAYPLMSTIVVNQANYSTACTLWYQIRVPKLHCGTAQSGSGANALELDDRSEANGGTGREIVLIDDYYNGAVVEVIDDTSGIVDIRSTISDYDSATHVLTIMGTPADGDTYGTVSRLPEETHELIVLEAAVMALMKPASTLDKSVLEGYMVERGEMRKEVYGWLESRMPEPGYVNIGDEY